MKIYLSTGGFQNSKVTKTIKDLNSHNIKNIELSGGKFEKLYKKKVVKLGKKNDLMLHNYFPRYEKPFVFNLASQNQLIINKSLNLAKTAIEINSKLNAKYNAFHAGFLFDPKINMLGDKPVPINIIDRKKGLKEFLKNVKILSNFASKKNIILLIENNVVSYNQFTKYRYKPLMCDIKESLHIMNKTSKNVFLLMDFAHLKVSANSLLFSKKEYLKKLDKYIIAYHLSDNNSRSDDNLSFNKNSWFWRYIKPKAKYCSIEVYDDNILKLKKLISLVNKKTK